MPLIEFNRKSCQQMLDFWKYEYGYPVDEDFDFSAYADGCGHFRFWDYEELFDASLDELVEMGYDRDEVEFCYAVLVYDAELIQKHIALKTNPNVFVSGRRHREQELVMMVVVMAHCLLVMIFIMMQ